MSKNIVSQKFFMFYILAVSIGTIQCQEINKTADMLLMLNKKLYSTTNDIFTILKLDKKFGEYFRIKPVIVMHRDLKQISAAKFKKYKDIESASKVDSNVNDIGNQLLNMTRVLDVIFNEVLNTSFNIKTRRDLSQRSPYRRIKTENTGNTYKILEIEVEEPDNHSSDLEETSVQSKESVVKKLEAWNKVTPININKKRPRPKYPNVEDKIDYRPAEKTPELKPAIDDAINHVLDSLKNLVSIDNQKQPITDKEKLLRHLKNVYTKLNGRLIDKNPKKDIQRSKKHLKMMTIQPNDLKATIQLLMINISGDSQEQVNKEKEPIFVRPNDHTPLWAAPVTEALKYYNHEGNDYETIRTKPTLYLADFTQLDTNSQSYKKTQHEIIKPELKDWVKDEIIIYKDKYYKEIRDNLNYTLDMLPFRARNLKNQPKNYKPISKNVRILSRKNDEGENVEQIHPIIVNQTREEFQISQENGYSLTGDEKKISDEKHILDYVYTD